MASPNTAACWWPPPPRLTAASTLEELEATYASISDANQALESQLEVLEEEGSQDNKRFQRIRAHSYTLTSNIEAIRYQHARLFELADRRETLQTELADIRSRLGATVVPAIDDQLFYTVTGYRVLGEPPAPVTEHFSEEEFNRYRLLYELLSDANIAAELLANAFYPDRPGGYRTLPGAVRVGGQPD